MITPAANVRVLAPGKQVLSSVWYLALSSAGVAPPADVAFVDGGSMTRPWYAYMSQLGTGVPPASVSPVRGEVIAPAWFKFLGSV